MKESQGVCVGSDHHDVETRSEPQNRQGLGLVRQNLTELVIWESFCGSLLLPGDTGRLGARYTVIVYSVMFVLTLTCVCVFVSSCFSGGRHLEPGVHADPGPAGPAGR